MRKLIKNILRIFVSILALYVVYMIWANTTGHSRISYVQNTTGVNLPSGLIEINKGPYYDYGTSLHVVIPEEKISEFTKAISFKPVDKYHRHYVEHMIKDIKTPYNVMPSDDDLIWFEGSSERNSWDFFLNEKNGNMWIMIFYPDLAGDLPPRAQSAE
jgi:hypothetical protein